MKRMMIIALSLVLVLTATPAFAYEDNPGMIIMDTLLVRPISMAAVVIGTAAFIVTLPFAAASGSTAPVAQALVVEPFKYTFNRPVGDFSWRSRYGEVQKPQGRTIQEGVPSGAEEKQGAANTPPSQ